MGVFVGQVGLSLSVVTGMTFGIVIDDTVHFLTKYLKARRIQNFSKSKAISFAFDSVGKALLITSIVLIAGFSLLTTSSFYMNSGMGLMTAIIIMIALISTFIFLPTILQKEGPVLNRISLLFILMAIMLPATGYGKQPSGQAIMEEVDKNDIGWKDSETKLRMLLKNKTGQVSERFLRIKSLEVVGDGDKSLTIFDKPKDVKGTAFLSHTHSLKPDDQWLYLPAIKRVKELLQQINLDLLSAVNLLMKI